MGALIDVNTDGLAKLGEVISYGLGLTAFGRKKMADAESYAAIKQAETNTQVELIKQKGAEEIANYILAKETRKLDNTKSVIEKAKSYLPKGEPVSNEPVNTDWINRFFNIVEDISDKTLHDIWGRILAGEIKSPNSYSLRTLERLRNITKEEAENKIIGLHEAYFDIKGNKGHASLVAGIDEEAGDVDSMYQLVLQRKGNLSAIEDEMDGK